MGVSLVRSTFGENVCPTAGNLEIIVANSQKVQNALRCVIDAGDEIPKLLAVMKGLLGLPPLSGGEAWQIPSYPF